MVTLEIENKIVMKMFSLRRAFSFPSHEIKHGKIKKEIMRQIVAETSKRMIF